MSAVWRGCLFSCLLAGHRPSRPPHRCWCQPASALSAPCTSNGARCPDAARSPTSARSSWIRSFIARGKRVAIARRAVGWAGKAGCAPWRADGRASVPRRPARAMRGQAAATILPRLPRSKISCGVASFCSYLSFCAHGVGRSSAGETVGLAARAARRCCRRLTGARGRRVRWRPPAERAPIRPALSVLATLTGMNIVY